MRTSSAASLLLGATFCAAGYGATFLLTSYFQAQGGGEIEAAQILWAALVGTFIGVPVVGWCSGRVDAAKQAAVAALLIASGYLLFSFIPSGVHTGMQIGGLLVGLGWGMFYIAGPMALSERIKDSERVWWFTRFSAFQMAGICGGPALLGWLVVAAGIEVKHAFAGVACLAVAGSILFALFTFREPLPRGNHGSRRWVRQLATLARTEAIRPIVMVGLGGCVFSGVMSFQVALTAGTAVTPARYFLVHAVTAIVARLLLGSRLANAPQVPTVTILLAVMTAGVCALLWLSLGPVFQLVSAVLTGFGYGLAYPLIQAWTINRSPPAYRHAALCWFVIAYFTGIFGFPAVGTAILVAFGKTTLVAAIAVLAFMETVLAGAGLRLPTSEAEGRSRS